MFWSDFLCKGCHNSNKDVQSVLGRDKAGRGEVWCQGRRVIAVEISSTCSGCAGKYLTTDSPEEKIYSICQFPWCKYSHMSNLIHLSSYQDGLREKCGAGKRCILLALKPRRTSSSTPLPISLNHGELLPGLGPENV